MQAHALSVIRHIKLWKAADRQKCTLKLLLMRGQSRYGVVSWLVTCLYNAEMGGVCVVNERVSNSGLASVDTERCRFVWIFSIGVFFFTISCRAKLSFAKNWLCDNHTLCRGGNILCPCFSFFFLTENRYKKCAHNAVEKLRVLWKLVQ